MKTRIRVEFLLSEEFEVNAPSMCCHITFLGVVVDARNDMNDAG